MNERRVRVAMGEVHPIHSWFINI